MSASPTGHFAAHGFSNQSKYQELFDSIGSTGPAPSHTLRPVFAIVEPLLEPIASIISSMGATAQLRVLQGGSSAGADAHDATTQLTDGQLAALAHDGDTTAQAALYRRHAGFAFNLAVRLQGSSTDVEDVVHDSFMRAFDRIGELRDRAAFRSWLGAIVVRMVRTRLRRRRLLTTLGLSTGSDSIELDSVASAQAGPELRAQLAQVYALLQTIPTNERIAWTLRYVDHHRLEAIAGLTGCSLATAKRRIARAQRFLEGHFVSASAEEER
jgi:RNA polymerase sigma-70 factor (ECF subfamily)